MATPAQRTNTWTLDQWYDQAVAGTTGGYQFGKELWTWGLNTQGELGINNKTNRSSPVQLPGTTWGAPLNGGKFAGVGENHMIALKTDGTLWTWGTGGNGKLGLNNQTQYSSPKQVGTDTTWNGVAALSNTSIATKTDGTLWAFGSNGNGQVGQNDRTNYSSPKQIGTDTTWAPIQTKSGYNCTFATKTDGTLWVCGVNEYGILGLNDTTFRSSPTQVPGTWSAEGLWAGYQHIGAIKSDGTLWFWGRNEIGAFGDNAPSGTSYSSPKQLGTATTWKQLTGSNSQSLALKTDGTLWAMGYNYSGNLGQNDGTNYSSPVQIPGTYTKISGGGNSCRAIKSDGTLWGWGQNWYGSLGQNSVGSPAYYGFSSPVQIPGTNWNSVASNYNDTAALKGS